MTRKALGVGIGSVALTVAATMSYRSFAAEPSSRPGEVRVTVEGGHDIADNDHGRPVRLIAAALGVPDDVFREAFSHVRPAHGRGPTGEEARKNKDELMSRLEKYGVTNDRLDEVSNFYRYQPQNGELWKHKDAVIFAAVNDGKVVRFRVAEPGYGYSSPPSIRVEGVPTAGGIVKLQFDRDLMRNGAISAVRPAIRPADPNGGARPRPPRPDGPPPPRPPDGDDAPPPPPRR